MVRNPARSSNPSRQGSRKINLASFPTVSGQRESRTAVVDVRDIRPGRPEAERPMTDRLHLVVHALQRAIRHPERGPGQDPVAVGADGFRQLLEGLEQAVARPPEPLAQVVGGPGGRTVVPEPAEVLLQQVRLHDRGVQPEEAREAGPFVAPEVRRVLQPEEPGALEVRLLRLGQVAPHLSADRIYGLGRVLVIRDPAVSSVSR